MTLHNKPFMWIAGGAWEECKIKINKKKKIQSSADLCAKWNDGKIIKIMCFVWRETVCIYAHNNSIKDLL